MAQYGGNNVARGPNTRPTDNSSSSRLPQLAPLEKYKVVFLGDQGTGKTSIIKAFMYGSFDENYQVSTISYLFK